MENVSVWDCVHAFQNLLDKEYYIELGRKNVKVTIRICFDKKDCFHLMGLQYLKDRPELKRDRAKIFDALLKRDLSEENIMSSDFFERIEDRVKFLPMLENILDDNDTVFKYNDSTLSFSKISADYLLQNKINERSIFVFLAKKENDKFLCKSFFPQDKIDYSKGQAKWTVLLKKKVNISTGEENILYERRR